MKKMYCILCLLFCLQFITSSAEAGPLQPGLKERCPVCGMYVAPYPHWIASITFQDGTSVYFGGPKDLFTYYLHLADSDLSAAMVAMTPAADPNRRGGTQLDLSFGRAFDTSGGRHIGHRLALEAGIPFTSGLTGPGSKPTGT